MDKMDIGRTREISKVKEAKTATAQTCHKGTKAASISPRATKVTLATNRKKARMAPASSLREAKATMANSMEAKIKLASANPKGTKGGLANPRADLAIRCREAKVPSPNSHNRKRKALKAALVTRKRTPR